MEGTPLLFLLHKSHPIPRTFLWNAPWNATSQLFPYCRGSKTLLLQTCHTKSLKHTPLGPSQLLFPLSGMLLPLTNIWFQCFLKESIQMLPLQKVLPSPASNFPSHLPGFCFLSPLPDLCRRLCLPLLEFKFHEGRVLFYLVLCLSPEPSQHLKIIQNTFNYQWMNTIPIMGTNSMTHMKRVWKCIVINVRHYYNLNFCCLNPDNRNTNSINSALSTLPKVFGFLRSVHIMCPYCASKNVYLNK